MVLKSAMNTCITLELTVLNFRSGHFVTILLWTCSLIYLTYHQSDFSKFPPPFIALARVRPLFWYKVLYFRRRSNCSAPIPTGILMYITFFGCPGFLITFFLPYPALIYHFNPFIFQCSALFFTPFFSVPPYLMTHSFLLTPGPPGGRGSGVRTIWLVHYAITQK